MYPTTCPKGHPVEYDGVAVVQEDGTYTTEPEIGDVYPCEACHDFYILTAYGFRRATDEEAENVVANMATAAENAVRRN